MITRYRKKPRESEDSYNENSGPDIHAGDLCRGDWAGDICGACGQEFTNRKAYRAHLRLHNAMPITTRVQ